MSKLVLPLATTSAREAATPVLGEILFDINEKMVVFGDGLTPGGIKLSVGVASMLFFAGYPENIPDGYLLVNGAEVSRTTYLDLFNAIGTRYGDGDGSNTFNLPVIAPEIEGLVAFISLGQTSRAWHGMTTLGLDIYACVSAGDIYKQTGGTGDFVALGQTSRLWRGMTTLGSDIYACVEAGDIYKQTHGFYIIKY